MVRTSLTAVACLSVLVLLSACGGAAADQAGDDRTPGAPTPGASAGAQDNPDAAKVAALAKAAKAESVHQADFQGNLVTILVWTGSAAEFWVDRGGRREKTPAKVDDNRLLAPGKPAAEFPLGDVRAAREAAGPECAEPVISVNLLPSGTSHTTTVDCLKPRKRLAAFVGGEPNPVPPDFYGHDYLAKQLDFAAKASPDGKIWSLALAIDRQPAGWVTLVDTTGYDAVDQQRCAVPTVAMPVQGRLLADVPGMGCTSESEQVEQGHEAPFDPAPIDRGKLTAAVVDVRQLLGDELATLTIAVIDGQPSLRAMNTQHRFATVALV